MRFYQLQPGGGFSALAVEYDSYSSRLGHLDSSRSYWVTSDKSIFDPIMACCTLVRDSSLSFTQKLSSVVLPATAITWMSKKRNQGIDSSNIEDFEMRVSDLENQMSLFNTVFINDNDRNSQAIRQIEFIERKE